MALSNVSDNPLAWLNQPVEAVAENPDLLEVLLRTTFDVFVKLRSTHVQVIGKIAKIDANLSP